jgi:hypothetical protein
MKTYLLAVSTFISVVAFFASPVSAQTNNTVMSTPPVSLEDKERMYNSTVEDRTVKIVGALALSDAAASNRVHDVIVAHYHALRARDEAMNYELQSLPAGSSEWLAQRIAMFPAMSQPLHDRFIASLAKDLTPAQLETVKDRMTYGKVAFTYNAYCSILTNLSDDDKAKILAQLKQAREVAMDGGSSTEKTAIFQQYKDRINHDLNAKGIDVAQATKDCTARLKTAEKNT